MKVLQKNQLQIAIQLLISLLLFRFALIKPLKLKVELSDFEFLLFIVSFIFIYAGSLLLFLIVKQEKYPLRLIVKNIDRAYYIYLFLNIIGIGISSVLANNIGNIGYFGFFIALAAILYLYITQWMKIPLINNIIFAIIGSYPIFVAAILDFIPRIDQPNTTFSFLFLFNFSFYFGILITILFFIKTIILDLKDVDYDREHNKKTLSTLYGIEKGTTRTSYLILIPIVLICLFVYYNFQKLELFCIYIVFAIALPLVVLFFQLKKSKNIKQFSISNNIINVIIWLTIFSIVLLFFNLKNYGTS